MGPVLTVLATMVAATMVAGITPAALAMGRAITDQAITPGFRARISTRMAGAAPVMATVPAGAPDQEAADQEAADQDGAVRVMDQATAAPALGVGSTVPASVRAALPVQAVLAAFMVPAARPLPPAARSVPGYAAHAHSNT